MTVGEHPLTLSACGFSMTVAHIRLCLCDESGYVPGEDDRDVRQGAMRVFASLCTNGGPATVGDATGTRAPRSHDILDIFTVQESERACVLSSFVFRKTSFRPVPASRGRCSVQRRRAAGQPPAAFKVEGCGRGGASAGRSGGERPAAGACTHPRGGRPPLGGGGGGIRERASGFTSCRQFVT